MELKLTALVIGNSTYENVDARKNPTNDAEDVSDKLKYLGFSVTTLRTQTAFHNQGTPRKSGPKS
jgi:uncharacterized caspase-like protein